MNRKRFFLVFLLLLLAAAAASYAFRLRIITHLGNYLVVEDPIEKSDAVKVMAGDFPSVILEAVDLYHEGYVKAIVLSAETRPAAWDELYRRGISIPYSAEWNRSVARSLGVPLNDIWVLGPPVQTTRQELSALVGPLGERGVTSLVIVSTKPHSRRCRMIAVEVMSPGIRVRVKPSRYDDYDPARWIADRFFFKAVFTEYQKLLNDAFHILG